MNTHKGRRMTAVLAIVVALATPSLFAQSQRITATVPFDFYVSDKLLPAGAYTIEPHGGANAIRVFDNRGNSAFIMSTILRENRAVNLGRLVFHKYGSTSFLTDIYGQGYKTGRQLASSKTEKRLAQNGTLPDPVAVRLK